MTVGDENATGAAPCPCARRNYVADNCALQRERRLMKPAREASMTHTISRRRVLGAAALAMAATQIAIPMARAAAVTAKDGTSLFVQSRGQGWPVVFIHGWSLNSD